MGRDRADNPILGLDRPTREALAVYVARRWPQGRRKAIEREWDLTPDQARAVMEGTPSATTIDDIWKHPRGGWAVALPVLGAVIGHGVGAFFQAEAERARHEADRRRQEADDLAAAERAAGAAILRLVSPGPPGPGDGLAGGLSDFDPDRPSRARRTGAADLGG